MNSTVNENRRIGFPALMILGIVYGVAVLLPALALPPIVYAVWLIIGCVLTLFGR